MLARIHGYLVLAWSGLTMVVFFLASLPVMLLTGSGELPVWLARRAWSVSSLWLSGVRVEASGGDALPPGPLIFACNHESALDIWAILQVVPRSIRFVAKQELFEIPIFGHYLRLGGHVAVDRRDRTRALASLRRAGEIVRAGTSLVFFAEGTRSRVGKVLPFKKGPFVVAMEAGVPVVPVAISGAARVNPAGRIEVRPGVIRVAFGEPCRPGDYADKTALLVAVRRRVVALHRALGGAGGDEPDVAEAGAEG
jgi:1-acyl-sn-glycerol-3-phosphate acyltransferase